MIYAVELWGKHFFFPNEANLINVQVLKLHIPVTMLLTLNILKVFEQLFSNSSATQYVL